MKEQLRNGRKNKRSKRSKEKYNPSALREVALNLFFGLVFFGLSFFGNFASTYIYDRLILREEIPNEEWARAVTLSVFLFFFSMIILLRWVFKELESIKKTEE